MTRREALAAAEKAYFANLLKQTSWNVAQAARIAGINRTFMWRRLGLYGIRRPVTEMTQTVRGAFSRRTNRCAAVPS